MLRLVLLLLYLAGSFATSSHTKSGGGWDPNGVNAPDGDLHGNLDPNGLTAPAGDLHGNLDPDG
jgi:hypothetical protein